MINRRNWLRNNAAAATSVLLSSYVPHVFQIERKFIHKEDEYLRLHWNENPYGASEHALEAAQKSMSFSNHYPDDQLTALSHSISKRCEVEEEQVVITAGSTEILSLLGQHVGLEKGEILMSESSFPTLAIFGDRCGASIRMIPQNASQQIDLASIVNSIEPETSLIFICNPNNPTSTDHSKIDLIEMCESIPEHIIICIDEAYIQYSRNGEEGSMIDQVARFSNVIVCRTFSKAYGLAGMRLGWAVGSKELIQKISLRHLGFGMANTIVGASAAIAALSDDEHLKMVVEKNEEGRKILYKAFEDWGVSHAPSATNFVYIKEDRFVTDVKSKLEKDKILITKWPSMKGHLRISIGRPEWMHQFVDTAKHYLI